MARSAITGTFHVGGEMPDSSATRSNSCFTVTFSPETM